MSHAARNRDSTKSTLVAGLRPFPRAGRAHRTRNSSLLRGTQPSNRDPPVHELTFGPAIPMARRSRLQNHSFSTNALGRRWKRPRSASRVKAAAPPASAGRASRGNTPAIGASRPCIRSRTDISEPRRPASLGAAGRAAADGRLAEKLTVARVADMRNLDQTPARVVVRYLGCSAEKQQFHLCSGWSASRRPSPVTCAADGDGGFARRTRVRGV